MQTHQEILRVVRGVALCILLAAIDQTIIVPAVPRMSRQLGGGHELEWIVSAYLLTGTAATPIFGKLSDVFGRWRLLRPAIIIFSLASIGCAAAGSFWVVVASRAVQGIGGAGLMVIAQTAISDVAPPRERGRYQIYMSGMWGIASIAGPMLGGVLTDTLSWRAIFWINLPLCAAAWALARRALRPLQARGGIEQKIDYLGAAFLVTAISAWLILASAGGQDFAWSSWVTAVLVAGGLVFSAVTFWVEGRVPAPILPPRLFTNGTVLGGLLLSGTNSLCTFGASFLLPLFYQYIKHTNAAVSGLLTTPFLLAFVVMSYAGGRLSSALGRTKPAMLVALAICAAGLAGLATMHAATALGLCELYSVLLGSGIGLVQPNITVAIQNAAERRDVGIATGCMLLFRAIGGAFGATLAAVMVLAHGFPAGFGACAAVSLFALLIAAIMKDAILRTG